MVKRKPKGETRKIYLMTRGGAGGTFCKKCNKMFILGTPLPDGLCKKCKASE